MDGLAWPFPSAAQPFNGSSTLAGYNDTMKRFERHVSYRVYVLRSWQEGGVCTTPPSVWRFSLEDPMTRQRRGFPDLAALMRFLAAETEESSPHKAGEAGIGEQFEGRKE
jgi:hypothetical protein